MRYFITLFLIIYGMIGLFAQKKPTTNLSGAWEGTVTQDQGGYKTEYRIQLYLKQVGEQVIGRSYVQVDDIFAEMEITGQLHSGMFAMLHDVRIVNKKERAGMEWCSKTYQLIYSKIGANTEKLDGHWQGFTSFSKCIPGKLFLRRMRPRA
jgi:hypothetical protein